MSLSVAVQKTAQVSAMNASRVTIPDTDITRGMFHGANIKPSRPEIRWLLP